MSGKTISIIGVTGLIGSHLYEEAQKDPSIGTIRLLVRRPFTHSDPKTEVKLVDFEDAESFKLAIDGSDAVFCAIGTTQQKVKGDKAAYRKVDYAIPVHAAQFCKETGCAVFVLVSSVGADSHSRNFYLHLKGEVEDAVKAMGIPAVHIMRPSLLLGKRKERRLGERIAQLLMPAISFLLPARYKPVQAEDVAKAMLISGNMQDSPQLSIYQYKEIKSLLQTSRK
jgi:uncharacterized protein YbjT (DUF2867 family)